MAKWAGLRLVLIGITGSRAWRYDMEIDVKGITGAQAYNQGYNPNQFGKAYNRGQFATACEQSPHKLQIDQWLNEGKPFRWISSQLEDMGERISEKSIAKYKSYRDQYIQQELMQVPEYNATMQTLNNQMVDGVSKIKQIDVMQHLVNTIEHCAGLLKQAADDEIHIKNVQDMRWVQQTLLDSIKAYGEIVLQAQRYAKVNEDPTLLKPQISVDVKGLLADMLGGMDDAARFRLIDRLRSGAGQSNAGGLPVDSESE